MAPKDTQQFGSQAGLKPGCPTPGQELFRPKGAPGFISVTRDAAAVGAKAWNRWELGVGTAAAPTSQHGPGPSILGRPPPL